MIHITAAAPFRRLARRDDGQDLIEYGLLISLIATFLVGTLTLTGQTINDVLWKFIDLNFPGV
jgi:Flp pilus assembly pilin Flp